MSYCPYIRSVCSLHLWKTLFSLKSLNNMQAAQIRVLFRREFCDGCTGPVRLDILTSFHFFRPCSARRLPHSSCVCLGLDSDSSDVCKAWSIQDPDSLCFHISVNFDMWLSVVNVMYGSNRTRWGRFMLSQQPLLQAAGQDTRCLFRLFFFPFCVNSTKACIVSAHLAWSSNTSCIYKVQCLLGRRTTSWGYRRKTGIIFLRDKLFSQTRTPCAPLAPEIRL